MTRALWTRRQFSQALAAASVLRWEACAATLHGFAYIGGKNALHSFEVTGAGWRLTQTLDAAAPIHLETHPTLPILYAVHAVDLWDHLPRGAVSAYRIDLATGKMRHLNTQPLSLAATRPRHAVASPDGRRLLVASSGGIYNLLPLAADGRIEPAAAICKELGLSSPHHVLFHPDGETALTVDVGQGTLGVFSVDEGAIRPRHRVHLLSAPSQVFFSPCGRKVYALQEGSLTLHRLDAAQLSSPIQIERLSQAGPARMTIHPRGDRLVIAVAGLVTVFAMDARSGRLSALHRMPLGEPLSTLAFTATGEHLLGITEVSGRVFEIPCGDTLGSARMVAEVEGASSLLFLPETS